MRVFHPTIADLAFDVPDEDAARWTVAGWSSSDPFPDQTVELAPALEPEPEPELELEPAPEPEPETPAKRPARALPDEK